MVKALVYLDVSALNRPFDDQSQPRIRLEAQALSSILAMAEAEDIELAVSSVHRFENARNPFPDRRRWVETCFGLAVRQCRLTDSIVQRARELGSQGISSLDALHLASAESLGCHDFLTCDDRIVRRYRGIMKVENPAVYVSRLPGRRP